MSAETYDKPSDDLIRVVNEFIDRSLLDGVADLTPLKLLKLVYFAQGWSLALLGRPLFNDPILAWRYGPVVHSLYRRLSHYGKEREPIQSFLTENEEKYPLMFEDGSRQKAVIDETWRVYGRCTGYALVALAHEDGGPWEQTIKKSGGILGGEISRDEIKKYFEAYRNKQ